MKLFHVAVLAVLSSLPVEAVQAETSYLLEPAQRQTVPMSFAQCNNLIHDYEGTFGTPRVILNVPTLRIVQFAMQNQTEQVACDGDSNVVTVFELGDE
jgi:hypothetical protein